MRHDINLFCRNVFESIGCLVDLKQDYFDVIIPDEIKGQFEDKDYIKFFYNKENVKGERSEFLHIGNPLISSLINIAQNKGKFTYFSLEGLPTTTGNLQEKILRKISFPNIKAIFKTQILTNSATALFNFKITYLHEDKFEEIKTIAINLEPLGLNEKFFTSNYSLYISEKCDFLSMKDYTKNIQRAYEIACKDLIKKQELTTEKMKLELQKKLKREMERIKEYYKENSEEVTKKLGRIGIQDKSRERLNKKLEVLRLEEKTKILDLEEKYKLRNLFKLLSIALVFQPKIRAHFDALYKDKRLELIVFWDPLLKDVELPYCYACNKQTKSLYYSKNLNKFTCKECL